MAVDEVSSIPNLWELDHTSWPAEAKETFGLLLTNASWQRLLNNPALFMYCGYFATHLDRFSDITVLGARTQEAAAADPAELRRVCTRNLQSWTQSQGDSPGGPGAPAPPPSASAPVTAPNLRAPPPLVAEHFDPQATPPLQGAYIGDDGAAADADSTDSASRPQLPRPTQGSRSARGMPYVGAEPTRVPRLAPSARSAAVPPDPLATPEGPGPSFLGPTPPEGSPPPFTPLAQPALPRRTLARPLPAAPIRSLEAAPTSETP